MRAFMSVEDAVKMGPVVKRGGWTAIYLPIVLGLAFPHVGAAQAGMAHAASQPAASATNQSESTLDVPIRNAPPQPPASEASAPVSGELGIPPDYTTGTADASASGDATEGKLPYLGIDVQYIVSDDLRGHEVHGLEVVAIDPASPAEQAGLHGRGQMTKLGATGATAGALMAPLDLIIMPLLKKAGDLGEDGDLIIAIDDNRVESDSDLKNDLGALKPGDIIYLTVVRQHKDGAHETLKLPVRLAAPRLSLRDASPIVAG
jgi:S1-C subfamily serine protease